MTVFSSRSRDGLRTLSGFRQRLDELWSSLQARQSHAQMVQDANELKLVSLLRDFYLGKASFGSPKVQVVRQDPWPVPESRKKAVDKRAEREAAAARVNGDKKQGLAHIQAAKNNSCVSTYPQCEKAGGDAQQSACCDKERKKASMDAPVTMQEGSSEADSTSSKPSQDEQTRSEAAEKPATGGEDAGTPQPEGNRKDERPDGAQDQNKEEAAANTGGATGEKEEVKNA